MTLLSALCILAALSASTNNTGLTYRTEAGKQTYTTLWTTEEKEGTLTITGKGGDGETIFTCSPEYVLKSFNQNTGHPEDTYSAKREGNNLIAEKNYQGHPLKKTHPMGADLWIQEFVFELKPFVLSQAKTLKFDILNPYDLSLNKMIAIKSGTESITLGNNTVQAFKVKITLQGFKHHFWKAYAWYDDKGTMLRYMGDKSPNSPAMTTTLQD